MTLDEVYGTNCFLAPRIWEEASRWLTADLLAIEHSTAQWLPCAGRMPVVVHRGGLARAGLSAMRDSGLTLPDTIVSYRTRDEYIDIVRRMMAEAGRAVTPYWSPEDVVPAAGMWIDPSLLRWLNNKASMEQLVPPAALARRARVSKNQLGRKLFWSTSLPTVIKVATDLPNGAGADVAILHRRHRIPRVCRRLRDASELILEEFLNISRNFGLLYAIGNNGEIRYLGGSEQICDRKGAYCGGLIDDSFPPPLEAVELGHQIARNGAHLGYRGLAGFDIVITRDERVLALDLNFRPVATTAQILLQDGLRKARKFRVSRLAFCGFEGALERALSLCRPFIEAGWLILLSSFDPLEGGLGKGKALARFLILGGDRAEVESREAVLQNLGFQIPGVSKTTGSYRFSADAR